jgi:hypothetical protein
VLKEAVVAITKGKVKEALDKLDVKTLATHEERIQWIANHWLALTPECRDKMLLFAPTHTNREAITQLLRRGLKQEGVLAGKPVTQSIFKLE